AAQRNASYNFALRALPVPAPGPPSRMSWRRILLLAAVLLSTVVGATWLLLQRSATPIVRAFLESELAAAFQLGSAEVDLLAGRRTMTSFAIAGPSRPGATLAAIDSVRLGVETDPFGALLAVHDVEVDGARLDFDLTPGHVPEPRALLRHASRG